MSEFNIDLRLPHDVLRKAPFVYLGPDFRSLPLGVISDIVEHRGKPFQRLYPFTVSTVGQDDGSTDQMFCFTFLYINDEDERVVFLTHPINLTNHENPEALDTLLAEAENLAQFVDSHLIEVEIHDQITGPVAFPTSLSFLSYNLDEATLLKPDLKLFEKRGFREKREVVCLDQSIDEFERIAGEKDELFDECIITSVSPRVFIAMKEKAGSFPMRSFELSQSDSALKPTNTPFFEDTTHVAHRCSRWSIRKGVVEGYLRWSPNIMEPFRESRTPYPLLFYHVLEQHAYKYGKIFDWGLRSRDRGLLRSLLSHAVKSMKRKGVERFQFAFVDGEEKFINNFLEEFGFKPAHNLKLLRKEVG